MTRSHVFHEIYLHVNWHCQDDEGMIAPDREERIHELIEDFCRKFKGVYFHGIGGTPTHIHLAIQVDPTVSLADFIGKAKGSTSFETNREFGAGALKWQRGYGIVSFAKRNLPAVLDYINNQKKHHGENATKDALERYYVDLPEGEAIPEAEPEEEKC
jgi:putative transposase